MWSNGLGAPSEPHFRRPSLASTMLALKKKREAEQKEREETAKNEAESVAQKPDATAASKGGKVALFGIGGQNLTKSGEGSGPKKSPGEIRIQKGKYVIPVLLF